MDTSNDSVELNARVLKTHKLFQRLSSEEIRDMVRNSKELALPARWELIREGESGDCLFYLISGSLQVYIKGADGHEIVLDNVAEGALIGEQALLPGRERKRNASVRTMTDSRLLQISQSDFDKALSSNSPYKHEAVKAAQAQCKRILAKQSALFQILDLKASKEWSQEVQYRAGDIVFKAGDTGTDYYFILDGEVSIQQDGKPDVILDTGQGFGEIALLTSSSRQATAKAASDCKLLKVDGEAFRNLYIEHSELRSYIQTLKSAYALRGYGVVTQHAGMQNGQDTLTTITHLESGRAISVMRIIGRDEVVIQVLGEGDEHSQHYEYVDTSAGIERTISVNAEGQLIKISSLTPWLDLGRAYATLTQGTSLSREQLGAFERTGQLFEQTGVSYKSTDIVCHCMQKSYQDLLDAIQQGVDTVEKIAEQFLCGTVCGGCKPKLVEITGGEGWRPAVITDEFELVNGVRSLRFKLFDAKPVNAQAGQHVVVRAPVKGHWINRPYTLTSAANEAGRLEITVKREAGGAFSNWVFDEYQPGEILHLSKPQGDMVLDPLCSASSVFFAAGIGVTPAISMLRTIARRSDSHRFHLDYSCRGSDGFAYRDEIQGIADESNTIDVVFRDTQVQPRLSAQEIEAIVQANPDAQFYICGPAAYQSQLEVWLREAGVDGARIQSEEFTSAAKGMAPPEAVRQDAPLKSKARLFGLVTLGLVLLQYLSGIEFSALEELQQNFNYQVASGCILLIVVLYQWRLAALRKVGDLQAASIQYHRHILVGSVFPVVMLFHSSSAGHGIAFALVVFFLLLMGTSYFDHEKAKAGRKRGQYESIWVPFHITLALLASTTLVVHIFIALAFK